MSGRWFYAEREEFVADLVKAAARKARRFRRPTVEQIAKEMGVGASTFYDTCARLGVDWRAELRAARSEKPGDS